MRWIPMPDPRSPMLQGPMAKRQERKQVVRDVNAKLKALGSPPGMDFRPVYGFLGAIGDPPTGGNRHERRAVAALRKFESRQFRAECIKSQTWVRLGLVIKEFCHEHG